MLILSDAISTSPMVNHVLMLLVDVSVKATVILVLAVAIMRLARRRSPRLSYSVLSAALIGVLALPLLSKVLPALNMPMLPRPVAIDDAIDIDYVKNIALNHSVVIKQGEASGFDSSTGFEKLAIEPGARASVINNHVSNAGAEQLGVNNEIAIDTAARVESPEIAEYINETTTPMTLGPTVIIISWILGVTVVGLWLAIGIVRLRQWARCGRRLSLSELGYDADWLAERVGVAREIAVIESDQVRSPLTFGLLSPVVLLPIGWQEWTRNQLRIVLLHEFMHVRRGDWGFLIVSRLVCATHWFNPLVWIAARRLEEDRELACDDDVVRHGARPSTYAETLLQMAVNVARPSWGMALSVNMASRPRLENRLFSILNSSKRRRAVASLPLLVILALGTALVAAIEPWHGDKAKGTIAEVLPIDLENAETTRTDVASNTEACSTKNAAPKNSIASAIRMWQEKSIAGSGIDSSEDSSSTRGMVVKRLPESASAGSAEDSKVQISGQAVARHSEDRGLRWQRTESMYRDMESAIREAVMDAEFDTAQKKAEDAYSLIVGSRSDAPSVTEYEKYRSRAAGLIAFVEDEAGRHTETVLTSIRREIENQSIIERAERKASINAQVRSLMNRAVELARLNQLEDAIVVLDSVIELVPSHVEARELRTTLADVYRHRRVQSNDEIQNDEFIEALNEIHASAVATSETSLSYPRDWADQTARRSESGDSDSASARKTREILKTRVPEISFGNTRFETALDRLRESSGLNLIVNWTALNARGIEPSDEISMRLHDVTYGKILDLLLQNVDAGTAGVGFLIDDDVIHISTKDDLGRFASTRVFDVTDLLTSVPNFKGPEIDLSQVGQGASQPGGNGGGRYLEGGGAGGSAAGGSPFTDSGGEDDEPSVDESMEPLIDLIRATIEPETWRSAGGTYGTISGINHQLVVTQTGSAHGQLEDL